MSFNPDLFAVCQPMRRRSRQSVGRGIGSVKYRAVIMRRQLRRGIEAPPSVEALLPSYAADVVKRASRGPGLSYRYLGDFVDASGPKLGRSSVDFNNLALRRPIRPAGRHDPTADRGSIV